MVALGIFILVTAAVYPQVVAGLRATGTARDITQAKGVAQAKLEQMRSMPFYVGREAGDYIDVLDTYYRNTTTPAVAPTCNAATLTALPPTTWAGYVPAGGTHCAWEPAGPLYRKVINPIASPGLGAFAMVVSTQFLSGTTPPTPVAPLAGYNSQTAGADQPPASQVGVTVAVFYRSHSGVKYTTTYTQIERSTAMDPLIATKAKATTVHVSSTAQTWADWVTGALDPDEASPDQPTIFADIGLVDLTGELFTGSRVIANATGAAASTSLPTAVAGAVTNLIAPDDTPATSDTAPDVALPNGCRWICFGATRTDQVSASASEGLPNAGTEDAPVRAMVRTGANRGGFWFDNGRWRNRLRLLNNQPMVSVDTSTGPNTMPGVRRCQVGGVGTIDTQGIVTATGFLKSTPHTDTDPEVAACATAQANTLRIFPTSFAPNGVIRVTLDRATAYCRVRTAATNTARGDYLATIHYWNGSGYTTAGVARPGNGTDPLDGVNLGQIIDLSGLTLGDYVASWSSLTGAEVQTRSGGTNAEVTVPAVVTILTGPTRSFLAGWGADNSDPTSAISISVGAVSCKASDAR